MAVTYYGEKISPNKVETRDGYVICLNVPIARIGTQDYMDYELNGVSTVRDYVVPGRNSIMREESDVFDDKTIASFEGVPITDNHPSPRGTLVNSDNWLQYARGTVTNVRRGTGEFANNIVADLHINDKSLVTIVDGKVKEQVSCGYTCEWVYEDGVIKQKKIRGNHVAIVSMGRAGDTVVIRDSAPDIEEPVIEDEPIVEDNMNGGKEKMSLFKQVLSAVFPEQVEKVDLADRIYAATVSVVDSDSSDKDDDKDNDYDNDKDDSVDDKKPNVMDSALDDKLNKVLDAMMGFMDKLANDSVADKKEDSKDDMTEDESVSDEDMVEKSVKASEKSATDLERLAEKLIGDSVVNKDPNEANVVADAAAYRDVARKMINELKAPVAAIKNDTDRLAVSNALLTVLDSYDEIPNNTPNTVANFIDLTNKASMANSVADKAMAVSDIEQKAQMESNMYKQRLNKEME